jgi:hypothetical protein
LLKLDRQRYIFNITNKLREVRINTANAIINYTPDEGQGRVKLRYVFKIARAPSNRLKKFPYDDVLWLT